VSEGKPSGYEHVIYCDRTDRPAVVYSDQDVLELVRLHTNMDDLPSDALKIQTGKDGKRYYTFSYAIEVTYQSGSTKYALRHNGE
jgi:hypothetical protein